MLSNNTSVQSHPNIALPTSTRSGLVSLLLFWIGVSLLLLSTTAIVLYSILSETASPAVAFLGFGLLGVLLSHRFGRSALYIFGAVYSINTLITIAIFLVYMANYGTPYYYGGSDDLAFEAFAQQAAHYLPIWEYSSIREQITGKYYEPAAYVYVVSILYRIGDVFGGFNTLLPRLLNALALGLISVLTFEIAKRSKLRESLARNTALIVGLLPIMTFNSAHTFRDVLVSLLILWVFYQWDKTLHGNRRHTQIEAWLWTALVAIIVWEFRPTQAALLLVFATGAYFFFVRRENRNRIITGVTLFILFWAFLAAFAWIGGVEWALQRLAFYSQYYTEYRLDMSSGLSNVIFAAPLPISIPLRFLYGLVSPLPFVGGRFEELFQGIGTVFHYFFLPFWGLGIICLIRRPYGRLWIWAFILFYSTAMITFTSRHVVVYMPYAALITAQGFALYGRHALKIFLTIIWSGVALGITYLMLKSM